MAIFVGTTTETREEALAIARTAVERRLAACVHVDEITSIYRWDGAVRQGPEIRVLLKTIEQSYEALRDLILELHSYDEPAIFCLPITGGTDSYLGWIAANSGGTPSE